MLGAAIILIGGLMVVAGRFPGLRIGRLPGDIYIERDKWRFYFPLASFDRRKHHFLIHLLAL